MISRDPVRRRRPPRRTSRGPAAGARPRCRSLVRTPSACMPRSSQTPGDAGAGADLDDRAGVEQRGEEAQGGARRRSRSATQPTSSARRRAVSEHVVLGDETLGVRPALIQAARHGRERYAGTRRAVQAPFGQPDGPSFGDHVDRTGRWSPLRLAVRRPSWQERCAARRRRRRADDRARPRRGPDDGSSARADGRRPADLAPPSWEEVVREHGDRVYRLAYRLTGNSTTPRTSPRRSSSGCSARCRPTRRARFEGWLHRITTNLFLDEVRRRAADPVRRRSPRTPPTAARAATRRPSAPTSTRPSTPTCRPRSTPSPPTSAPPSCCATSRASPTRRSRTTLDIKLGTVRSRIHRGRSQLRAALPHLDPARRASQADVVGS